MSGNKQNIYGGFVQFDVKLDDVDDALARIADGLQAMHPTGPGIVVLPELCAGGFAYDRLAELADQRQRVLAELAGLARQYGVHLAGSLVEGDGGFFYNTLHIVGPGGVAGIQKYRKQQLFAPMAEDRFFAAGDTPRPIATTFGPVAGLVCYDLRFPDLAQSQCAAGAKILVVAAQWPTARREHWRVLVRARAIENQVFVIACNRSGFMGGTEFGGHSMIVGPDGAVLLEAGETPLAAGVCLDCACMAEVRGRFATVGRTPWRFHDLDKIAGRDAVQEIVRRNRAIGRRTVFTNGCFDILHAGHVTYLEAARRHGDCLVVGLNSDASIRRIKGPSRPVNSQEDRARVLAALGCVDHLVIFDEDTPHALISALVPDVLVKGADWSEENIVGAAEVKAAGGRVITIPLVSDRSTTGLIDRIRTT